MGRLHGSVLVLAALAIGCGDDGGGGPGDAPAGSDAGQDAAQTGDAGTRDRDAMSPTADGSTAGQGGSGGRGGSGGNGGSGGSAGSGGNGGSGGGSGGSAGNPDAGASDAGEQDAAPARPCMPAGQCDPFSEDPCGPEACRPTFDGTECRALMEPVLDVGDPCPVPNENACRRGTACIDFGDGQRCHRLCRVGSVGMCDDTQACSIGALGDSCVFVCRPFPARCDIFEQDCADSDDTCTLATHPETGERYTGCRPAGPRAEGEPCGGLMGTCGHGLICVGSFCRQVCNPDDSDPGCDSPQECTGMSSTYQIPFCD